MSPKAKNVKVSSSKSMDITTNEKDKMPKVKTPKPVIVKPSGMIKDVSPNQASEDDNIINSPKIEMSEKLVSNLKSPSESKIKILPTEPPQDDEKTPTRDADDLTNDEDDRDSSFIDNISDEKDELDNKVPEETKKPITSEKVEEKPASSEEKSNDSVEDKPKEEVTKNEDTEEEKPQEDEGGIVNEMAEQAADTKKQKQEEKELEVRSEHVQELIDAKTYNVPIGQLSRKRNIRVVIVASLLLIICGLFALNFAVDAGMVDIGVEPLTDVISN